MNRLARVVDPEALERLDGTRGKMRIEVPETWAGASIRVALPRQLLCATCDGGGCDLCDRSGALRAPSEGSLDLRLPEQLGEGVVVRVVHPFGASGSLEMLLIEVRPGLIAAACVLVSLRPGAAAAPQPARANRLFVVTAFALALLVVVLAWSLR